jgi:hypothetical protein
VAPRRAVPLIPSWAENAKWTLFLTEVSGLFVTE